MVGTTTLEVAKSPVPKTGGLPLTLHPDILDTFFSIRALPTELSPHDGESWT